MGIVALSPFNDLWDTTPTSDQSEKFWNNYMLWREAAAYDIVGIGHDLYGLPSKIGMRYSSVLKRGLTWLEPYQIEEVHRKYASIIIPSVLSLYGFYSPIMRRRCF